MSKDKPAEGKKAAAVPAAEPAKEAKKPAEPQITYVTSTDLAKKLGTKGTILRRWLRTLPKYQDSGYTRYKWEEGDPFLNDAEASFKKYQASAEDKKVEREKERADKATKTKEEKAAKPKKEKAKPAEEAVEEEDAEGGEEGDEGEELD